LVALHLEFCRQCAEYASRIEAAFAAEESILALEERR
jgi:hypothetical protein